MQFQKRAALFAPLLIATSAPALAQTSHRQRVQSGHQPDPRRPLCELFAGSEDVSTAGFPARRGSRARRAKGLSLDETELAISANVDDKYYGF